MPRLLVLKDRYVNGAKTLDDLSSVEPAIIEDMYLAMERTWRTDAHFVTYTSPRRELQRRINKPVLPAVLNRFGQDSVEVHSLFVDYDNPGHEAWTKEHLELFLKLFRGIPAALRSSVTVMYATSNGARIGWQLDRTVGPDEAESLSRGLVRDLGLAGFPVDPLHDWTRLFRLPKVRRWSKERETHYWQHEGAPFNLQLNREARLAVESIVPIVSKPGEVVEIVPVDAPKPEQDTAKDMLQTDSGKESKWYKKAKKIAEQYDAAFYPYIFEGKVPAPGSRNMTITSVAGGLVGALIEDVDASPESLYALMLPMLEQIDGTHDGESWVDVGWDILCRMWAADAAKLEAKQQVTLTTKERIVQGVQSWCGHPGAHQMYDQAIAWILKRAIAASSDGQSYYILTPDGEYDRLPVTKSMLNARIKDIGMGDILITRTISQGGAIKAVDAANLLEKHGTTINEIVGIIGQAGAARIEGLGTKNQTLKVMLFSRAPLDPLYNEKVDQWLKLMAGKDYAMLQEWIAWSLALEEGPICALSLVGPPGCGKSLLVQGLAECIDTGVVAEGDELLSDKMDRLLATPFLHINEGFPKGFEKVDPADRIRQLISGDPIKARKMYRSPITIRNPVRIILTANNDECVSTLFRGKVLDEDDRAALAQRILHMRCSIKATHWFEKQGGRKLTQGWVSDPTGRTEHIVARHFMWLYQNRHGFRTGRPDGRWLVSGVSAASGVDDMPELMRHMLARSGGVAQVIRVLVRMLRETAKEGDGWVVSTRFNSMFVTAASIRDVWDKMRKETGGRPLDVRVIGKALKALADPMDERTGSYKHPLCEMPINALKRRWTKVDLEKVLMVAEESGDVCTDLIIMVKRLRAGVSRPREATTQDA